MKTDIHVQGTYKLDHKVDSFDGIIKFDVRANSIYYSWNLFDKQGGLIASKTHNVAFQQIPIGVNKLEFSKLHAIEGIKKYRIGRDKIIQELTYG